jgi:hypothetical protein
MFTHACRAASSFATFWLFPTPRPFSVSLTDERVNHTAVKFGDIAYYNISQSTLVDEARPHAQQDMSG